MKFFIIIAVLVASTLAQRPPYAGTKPIGVPDLAARFKTDEIDGGSAGGVSLGNRVGVIDGTTERLPVDARGDADLVHRIKDWPEENRPFWFTNAEAIEKQRGTSNTGTNTNNLNSNPNQNQSPVNNPGSGRQPTVNGNGQLLNRFGGNTQSLPDNGNSNSFNVVMNNQWKTYVYDPVRDAWYLRNN